MSKGLIIVIGIILFLGGWVLIDFGESVDNTSQTTMSSDEIDSKIKDTTWNWISFSDPKEGEVGVEDPENYTILLNSDGTMNIRADCNQANTTYELDNGNISIGLMAQTLAFCPHGSLSDQFLIYLSQARIYFLEGENLYFDLEFDSGAMKFE